MMGNTWWGGALPVHLHARFVDLAQEHGAEIERPDPIPALLQTDVMLLQGVRQKEQLVLEADRSRMRDSLDQEVARVLERGQRRGIRARGADVARPRWVAPKRGVRPLVVVLAPE